jgi:endonuclease/exonuclease/phosphatase family metal-dependent hydrolase
LWCAAETGNDRAMAGGVGGGDGGSGTGRARVLTMNLLSPQHADWERRRPVLIDGLRTLRPDLVALQETAWGNGYDQAADLLGPEFRVARHSGRSADGVGAAMASRWPLGTVQEVDLHVTERTRGSRPCAGLAVEVLAPAPLGPLLFVHHKPNWQFGYEHERELQALTTARFVEDLVAGRDLHVVLAGDFDDPPDAASIRFWTGRQSLHGASVCYQDAWEVVHPGEAGHTFSPRNPLVLAGDMPLERGRRIDYVMVRCGVHGPTLDVAGCELAFDQPVDGVWASDHFGLAADLELPPRPPGSWE